MAEKITANYRIVTPMFIGDAEQNASGISPNSVKGSLRFWWRALHWSRCLQHADNNEDQALRLLHQQEAVLFGSATDTQANSGGQGVFLLRVIPKDLKTLSANELDSHSKFNLKTSQWHSYLLGLGLMEYNKHEQSNNYQRSAIVSGSFSLQLMCRNQDKLEELKELLLLWGLLGGLGSRNRKGFGSISITELTVSGNQQPLPETSQQLGDMLKKRLSNNQCTTEPPYSAFSQHTRLLLSEKSPKPAWQQLGGIARTLQHFRGWGYKSDVHRINNEKVNHETFSSKTADHDLVYQLAQERRPPTKIPTNLVFGLPRSFTLSSMGIQEIKLEAFARDSAGDADNNKRSRRASPLFIHVHQFNDNAFSVLQLFLPARFLPAQDMIKLKRSNGEFDIPVAENTDWQVINAYLSCYSKPQWQEL